MNNIKSYQEFTNEEIDFRKVLIGGAVVGGIGYLTKFESFSMHRDLCDRCHKPTGGVTTMSMFNKDVICMDCKEEEKKDPEYEAACEAEREAVKRGDYNFSPIPNYKPIKRK